MSGSGIKFAVFLALTVACVPGCSKRARNNDSASGTSQPPAPADVTALVQPATDTPPSPPPPPSVPQPAEPPADAPAEAPRVDTRIPPEIARVMIKVQQHALATGRFPTGWEELIAAKVITQPPMGKNGQPMPWKEFMRAIDPE
jgi:hypothetical protein